MTAKGKPIHLNMAEAILAAFGKLAPKNQLRNPVMFVVYVGAIVTTLLYGYAQTSHLLLGSEPGWFTLWVALWLWFTVLFANFAESVAEGRGKAQAESLRALRKEVSAKKLRAASRHDNYEVVSATSLRKDDIVFADTGDFIPGDGQVIDGIASVDESAITGESAPVIRESGGDCDAVTGGTRILSDWLVIRITANAGETFIDRMVALVEGAKRQKTPNEIALSILLAALTIIFLLAVATLLPFSIFSTGQAHAGQPVSITVLIALLVCLAPTTIGGLLSAIGIAGMNRLLSANVIASSGRAVEAAGDVNVLLLDKTGTITHGNRQAEEFYPAPGITITQLAEAAQLSSLADQTPEGKSIVALAQRKYNMSSNCQAPEGSEFIAFSAETRCSGIKAPNRQIVKGAPDAIEKNILAQGSTFPDEVRRKVEEVARLGGTPLVVAEGAQVLGVVYLKDIVKAGIKERLADLRKMGIKSIMITGDNPLTAAAIAAEAGVDDFLAQATPEAKLKLIRKMQTGGELVAMVGDGTNDAPALAQSDVAVVMNSGTQAAKEAGNMIDLDSDPTKLIEIVEIGKQLLMTRGSLTTFSIANDLAKYFAIIPAAFASTYPELAALNVMHLTSPVSGMLSAVIFNAVIIVALIPLALRGVKYRPVGAAALLRRNLLYYGLGGVAVPFVGIKMIDMLLALAGAVLKNLRAAFSLLLLLTLLLGGVYPLMVMGFAQVFFPHKADGSLIMRGGTVLGSSLLGQEFDDPKYFWGRLSATTPPYNAAASSASNFSPGNPKLLEAAGARIAALKKADPQNKARIPVDLVTASASGLDPHISLAAADYQLSRVARARGMKEEQVKALVEKYKESPGFGLLSEPYVNVVRLNLALDEK